MDEAVRYYADVIRAESLKRQADEALENGDIQTYRSLSAESSQIAAAAERYRMDIVRQARQLALATDAA